MKKIVLGLTLAAAVAAVAGTRSVPMQPGESWWGASNSFGTNMPFNAATQMKFRLTHSGSGNQAASLLVSDKGREIWCDEQTDIAISNGVITLVSKSAPVEVITAGKNLREAYAYASQHHFPPSGKMPDALFFTAPQYNTWVELTYHQNEKDILAYAQAMLDHGLPPGVLMIDDTWQFGYGVWEFDPRRFSDPKGMVEKLHKMGFKVMLWMCPWVGMDTPAFRELAWGTNHDSIKRLPERGGFLQDGDRPAASRWWNGYSALLDFTHPLAVKWFRRECTRLMNEYGIDGFKFDGGDMSYYNCGYRACDKTASSGEQSRRYAEFAAGYALSEYRCAWQMAGQPLVMRLYDKGHRWGELQCLVPDMLAGGLLGHQFLCPDMIGGGSWHAFLPDAPIDQELVVRSAQVHALCGMMQFSVSPWRILDREHQAAVQQAVATRQKFADYFLALARRVAKTGEPMIRHLEYMFPGQGYQNVRDAFMMGDDLLVAPQVEKGATSRTVPVPPGIWLADDGTRVTGPTSLTVSTPLARLPYFTRVTH